MSCGVCNATIERYFPDGTPYYGWTSCSQECARVAYQIDHQREMNQRLIVALENLWSVLNGRS